MDLQNRSLIIRLFISLVLLAFIGCGGNQEKEKDGLQQKVRNQVKRSLDSNSWSSLFNQKYDSLRTEKEINTAQERYWAVLSASFLSENIPEEAEKALLQAMKFNKNFSGVDSLLYKLGETLDEHTNRKLIAKTYYKVILDYHSNSAFSPMAKNNLPSDMKALAAQIEDTERVIQSKIDAKEELPARLIKDYITLAQLHAIYVSSKESPAYLLKAAAIARGYGNINTSKQLYDYLIYIFKDSPQAAEALFQKAFMLDQEQENDTAEKLYNRFMEKYPKHELIPQVEILLKEVHLSEEEILKRLQRADAE
jgi:outer membrane protein assembly factor BamD (BamD/ComL family)